MRKKIGIFGGTFDPIHLGHVGVAISLFEKHKLDEVIFVPAAKNPQKGRKVITNDNSRLKMISLAIQDIPSFSVSTVDLERASPSYMIDTVSILAESREYKGALFFLLLGDDLLSQFMKWKDPHELVHMAQPLIAKREDDYLEGEWEKDPIIKAAIVKGMTVTPRFEISSTEIRKRLKKGFYCGHLVDRSVLEYIKNNDLYLEGKNE